MLFIVILQEPKHCPRRACFKEVFNAVGYVTSQSKTRPEGPDIRKA